MTSQSRRRLLYLPPRLLTVRDEPRQAATASLQALAASMVQVGVLQPLTVRKIGSRYQVISGTRRLTAARMAGLRELPCLLLEDGDTDPALIALTENLHREDLGCFREAELLEAYLRDTGMTRAQAASRLGMSPGALTNKLRLLHHSPAVRQKLEEAGLSERHARVLLRLESEEARLRCIREVAARRMTVAQTEQYVEAMLENGASEGDRRLRRREIRLLSRRMEKDAAALRQRGIQAEMTRKDIDGEIVLTLRVRELET